MITFYALNGEFIQKSRWFPKNFTGFVEWPDGSKEWFMNGNQHRLEGPAFIGCTNKKLWYVDGKEVTEEQCKLLHDIMKLKGIV